MSNPWAVAIRDGDYTIRELASDELLRPDVIAVHPSRRSAELALERVETFHQAIQKTMAPPIDRERALRDQISRLENADRFPDLVRGPMEASLKHDADIRNGHLTYLFEIARPRAEG